MDLQTIIAWFQTLALTQAWAAWVLVVCGLLGCVTTVASVVVAATPTKADDELLARIEKTPVVGKVWSILNAFSLVKKKSE